MRVSNSRTKPSQKSLAQIFYETKLTFSEIANQEENFFKELVESNTKFFRPKNRSKRHYVYVYQIFLLFRLGLCYVKAHHNQVFLDNNIKKDHKKK